MILGERCFIRILLHIQIRRAVLGKAEMSVECLPSVVPVHATDLASLQPCFHVVILLHTRLLLCHFSVTSSQGGQIAGGMNFSSNEIDLGNKTRPRWMMWLCSTCTYTGIQWLCIIGGKTSGGRDGSEQRAGHPLWETKRIL